MPTEAAIAGSTNLAAGTDAAVTGVGAATKASGPVAAVTGFGTAAKSFVLMHPVTVAAAGTILFGAVTYYAVKRWRRKRKEDETITEGTAPASA